MKELLDSDRVNYLVWRYLLESNYRETAARLQKEWRVQAPHKHFDFAPHVNTYALVTLLQKGLIYEDYHRQFAGSQQVSGDGPATAEVTERGVFGPLRFEPAPKDGEGELDAEGEEDDEEEESVPEVIEEPEPSKKRPVDSRHHILPNGSPTKRQRLSNGYENGADLATTPMEIDHPETNNHAYPSPQEGEQVASPLPRTDGPEQGTQVEKVNELTSETLYLQLGAGQATEGLPTRTNENPIVLHCEWNPRDPSFLAAAGTDALARVWNLSRGAAPESHADHVDGAISKSKDFLDPDTPKNATVSAVAWSPDGQSLALAVETTSGRNDKARIVICGLDGTVVGRLDGFEPPVIKLRWSPDGLRLLSVCPENGAKGSSVSVYSAKHCSSITYTLADHDLSTDPLDATWINDTEFLICGGNFLRSFQCKDDIIKEASIIHQGNDETFSQVHYDPLSRIVATASDKGNINIWDESGQHRCFKAHDGQISALQWQPSQETAVPAGERLLASAGVDGIICLWNVLSAENKAKYSMTMNDAVTGMSDPVIGMSITPDGAYIAGATDKQILIWKIGEHSMPQASWKPETHPGWHSPKANGDEEELTVCLGWDADGHKLVYGANMLLAVIKFVR